MTSTPEAPEAAAPAPGDLRVQRRRLPSLPQRTSNLSSLLRQTAARLPAGTALVRGAVRWSWRELDARADALAAALGEAGIGPGDVVMLHAGNCRDYLTVMVATWRVGAVITPTNSKLTPADVARLAEVVRPDLLVVEEGAEAHAAALAPVPCWTLSDGPGSEAHPHVGALVERHRGARVPDAQVAVGEPAWFFFTSGSSGRPKAAVLTHDQMAFVVNNHIADLMPGLDADDATLVLAPLSHGAGVHVLTHVARGAAVVLLPGESLDVAQAWDLIAEHRVSTLFTVPTILNRLVQGVRPDTDLTSLAHVVYAGAPITRQDQARARQVLGPVVEQYYGLCEVTGAITVLPPSLHEDVPTVDGIVTAGHARTGMTLSIQDPDGRHLPAGERGEICVVGPAVFCGYLGNDAANASSFREGWFRTGDLGLLDEHGLLYITGRASDMYISGGSNIDPREVEEKILAHPAVRAVGVVGAPDPDWGEVGYAVAVVEDGLGADELLAWCREHMARYKAPKRVHLVDQLPTTAYGKVTTAVLRELLQSAGAWPAGSVR
ncbi:AMP-binding protein [Nocardioides bruguierae]|uniref:AMP-binding protein n=1 Tax=Nocardioides bruguierae TaxID=2945102 RepID=UPI0020204F97|nr:AMP-binding protein [Nocardioides bruguierae]MCL8026866.1 AMP-binding protein [Nocardioides bruguierae]